MKLKRHGTVQHYVQIDMSNVYKIALLPFVQIKRNGQKFPQINFNRMAVLEILDKENWKQRMAFNVLFFSFC